MKKKIVFFCATTPYVMVYKMAREFRKNGYETILITISQRDQWEEEWYKDGFDKIICSNFQLQKPNLRNLFNMVKRIPFLLKAVYQMKCLRPYVVFGVARPNLITSWARKFFKQYPFIYFPYDITSHFYPNKEEALKGGIKKGEILAEKDCLENSEGILHKGNIDGLEIFKKETMLGPPIKISPLQINFPPYCGDDYIIPLNNNKLSKKDKQIHLVYVGGLSTDKASLDFYEAYFKELINAGIHVHIYSKTQHLSKEEDKKNLSGLIKNLDPKFFHIEFALPPKELIKEISKYDFGIWPVYHVVDNKREENEFTSGNKIASYLEAGIPFFYNHDFLAVDKIMKHYCLDFPDNIYEFDIKRFTNKIKKTDYKKTEKNILKMREDFNVKKNFPRLERFVKKVVSRKKEQQFL